MLAAAAVAAWWEEWEAWELPSECLRGVPGQVPPVEISAGPLLFQPVDTSDMVKQNPGKIEQEFRALGAQVKEAGAQVIFCDVLSDKDSQMEVNPSWRTVPGFMAGGVIKALVSVIMGSPSTNTAFLGETESTYLCRRIFTSRWADFANTALN